MLCYQDRTFCKHYEDCQRSHTNGGNCTRPLTPEVVAQAEKWMRNPLIAVFGEQPLCHVAITVGETNEPGEPR